MEQHPSEPRPARQPYEAPAVIYEAALEVRAGSPLRLFDVLKKQALPDPAGLYKQK
jgi:hypothetical protein